MIDPCKEFAEAYRKGMLETDGAILPYLVKGNYSIDGGRLLSIDRRPHQPNNRLLAETLYQLKPVSVAEFGSGCGVNLHNLSLVLPKTKLFGYELCQSQIDVMHEVFSDLVATVWSRDITRPNYIPNVDVSFCHVVLMHLANHNQIVAALENMLRTATKQVVMLENWGAADFMAATIEAAKGVEGWEKPLFYSRTSPELHRAHIMIISKTPLKYTPILSYEAELAAPVRENWMKDVDKVFDRSWERV